MIGARVFGEEQPHQPRIRLLAWNLGHRTREVAIPAGFFRAVELIGPDVLVLNEFKDGETRSELRDRLGAAGLGYVLVSCGKEGHNQVLVASRTPIEMGDLGPPGAPDDHAFTNFLHVRHLTTGLEFVGMRAPAYPKISETAAYWRAMEPILRGASSRRVVFAGDFNVDPLRGGPAVYSLFSSLLARGWQLPQAAGAWSYVSGTRIDHVFASPSVGVTRCEYVREIGGVTLASPSREQCVSDHAAVVAEISLDDSRENSWWDPLAQRVGEYSESRPAREPDGSVQSVPVQSVSAGLRPPYASMGSQRWLQVAVAECPDILNSALQEAGAVEAGDNVNWKSPIACTRFEEYRDGAALRLLGIERLHRRELQDFWPNGGPVWDGLAVSNSGRMLLLEAKAHIAEAASPPSRASAASLDRIRRSLGEARQHYSPRATADWSGHLYQYGNRLAFQYLLKAVNGLDSRLVFLHFCGAPDVRSPESPKEWEGAIELIHALLGLPSDLRKHGVHHAYVDVRDMLARLGGGRKH